MTANLTQQIYHDEAGNRYAETGERRVPQAGEWFTSSHARRDGGSG